MPYIAEYTDTYGGESNYSWVRRATLEVGESENPSRVALMRRAKKALGLSGLPGRTVSYGDMLDFRPYGCATVLFIFWRDGDI